MTVSSLAVGSAAVVSAAANIARKVHKGHVDKSGVDYFSGHLTTVASLVNDPIHKAIAYLHDSIEDAGLNEKLLFELLTSEGVDKNDAGRISSAVSLLSKPEGSNDYWDYIENVSKNPDAWIVKVADIIHNSDLSRLNVIGEDDLLRVKKYRKALEVLRG